MSMAAQGLLDDDIFALRLREPRELTFGGVNASLYMGEFTKIPLSNKKSPYGLTGRWQAEANYLAVGSIPGIRTTLEGLTASFVTSSAYIMVPDLIVHCLLRDLEFEERMFMPPSVSCDRRASLPDLTFNLAGRNFTLTPYDWTFEWPLEHGITRCVSAVTGIGLPPEEVTEIVLGSAFLRAFYSVFNLEEKTIGCEFSRRLEKSGTLGHRAMLTDY